MPITFDDCRLPEDALLGQLHQGFPIAMTALDGGRIGISAQAVGIASGALEEATAYAKDRRQFERPIAEFQGIQWLLADSQTELDAARLLCLRAASLKLEGKPFTREASMAKLFASEAANRICDRALQVHGGYGYVRDFAVERHLRDVRVTRIYEGTSEIQRIGDRAHGAARFVTHRFTAGVAGSCRCKRRCADVAKSSYRQTVPRHLGTLVLGFEPSFSRENFESARILLFFHLVGEQL